MANETSKNLEWAYNPFWMGFMSKAAAVKLPKFLPRMPTIPGAKPLVTPEMPAEVKRMAENVVKPSSKIKPATEALDYSKKQPVTPSAPKIKPATEALDYKKMNSMPKVPEAEAGTVEYGSMGVKGYKRPPKAPAPA